MSVIYHEALDKYDNRTCRYHCLVELHDELVD
jgi:hypothetical protein